MRDNDDVSWLVDGPRGRRLCWQLIEQHWLESTASRFGPGALDPGPHEIVDVLTGVDPEVVADRLTNATLWRALADSVDVAMYWNEPDGRDLSLDHPGVRDALLPLAARIAALTPEWWSSALALDRQRLVEWATSPFDATELTGTAERLRAWHRDTREGEARSARRRRDLSARGGGNWWSAPCIFGLPCSTRALPGLGAVGLELVEDAMGWENARCVPIAASRAPRVVEIADARNWVELVARYPLEVTWSRRHDWFRTTDHDGRWLLPNYAAIRVDHDAVHVSPRGYLATAGRALPVDETACTVLAGWAPDETYWLTDCLEFSGPDEHWVREQQEDWRPA